MLGNLLKTLFLHLFESLSWAKYLIFQKSPNITPNSVTGICNSSLIKRKYTKSLTRVLRLYGSTQSMVEVYPKRFYGSTVQKIYQHH